MITADNGTSLFSGNYVSNDGGATQKYEAVYMADADLSLSAINNGTITFDDGINGENYNINILGDASGTVKFNNLVENVTNFTLSDSSVVHLGVNANIQTQNMSVAESSILVSQNDGANFDLVRVIGSPYVWGLNKENTGNGYSWSLDLTDYNINTLKQTTPEVIAGVGLHEAAIEQTRSLVRNVRTKVADNKIYCADCGIMDYGWQGNAGHNAWVNVQGETATLDKPAKMDADIWGIEAGFDVQNDVNNTLGVFASYRKGEYDLSGKGSKVRSTSGSEIDIDSYLGGLYYRYDKNMNWLFATVYGGVQQADAKTDDKEYDWKDIKHLEAELGTKLEKQIDYAKIYVKPSVIQTITSGDSVKITGLNKLSTYDDATLGRIELGGRYGFTDALLAYGWVNYTFGSDYDATAFGAGLNYAW